MNREIKFRGWHKGLKKMLYPPLPQDSMPSVRDSNGNHIPIDIDGDQSYYPAWMNWEGQQYINGVLQGIEFMQFTGKFDKNKKPIYEGDILEYRRDSGLNTRYQVYWSEEACGFKVKRKALHDKLIGPTRYSIEEMHNCEIVGNVFENPDLLNEQGYTI